MTGQVQDPLDPNLNQDVNLDQQLDTQESQPASPIQDENGHDEQQITSTPSPQDSGSQDDLAARREAGKLQQVQRELETARKDQERLRTIEQNAVKSPDKFKRALVDYSGWNESEADHYVQQLQMQGVWNQPQQGNPQQPQQQAQIDPQAIAAFTHQTIQRELMAKEVQTRFFERVPELDPSNIPPERQSAMAAFANALETEASRRVQSNGNVGDFVNELVNVYKEFTGKTDEQINTARSEGRMEGYLEANSTRAATSRSSKGYTPKGQTYGLTAEEVAQATAEGLSAEEFAKLKDPVSIVR